MNFKVNVTGNLARNVIIKLPQETNTLCHKSKPTHTQEPTFLSKQVELI